MTQKQIDEAERMIVDAVVGDQILRSAMTVLRGLHSHSDLAHVRKILIAAMNKTVEEMEQWVCEYSLLTEP